MKVNQARHSDKKAFPLSLKIIRLRFSEFGELAAFYASVS
jgi:hypothetical protein